MMTRLFKSLLLAAIISTLILILIPADPKNARFLGFSTSRLVLIAVFLTAATLFAAAVYYLHTRPLQQQKIEQSLAAAAGRKWLREVVLLVAALVVLAGLYLAVEYWSSTDAMVNARLLRALPVAFFGVWVSVEILNLPAFRESGRRWLMVAGWTVLGTVAGRMLQVLLLAWVIRPAPVPRDIVSASELGLAALVFLHSAHLFSLPSKQRPTWALFLLLVAVLAVIQWSAYPEKYWRTLPYLALFTPLAVFAAAALTQLAFDLYDRKRPMAQRRLLAGLSVLAVLGLIVLIWPYLQATLAHSRSLNYAPIFTDQGEYLQFAKTARMRNFLYTGDHNRMPLYPIFQGIFYQPGISDEVFFEAGKLRNILLSMILLGLLFLIFRKTLSTLPAALLTGIIGFSLYIFKAPYFQAEILFYFLAFLGFVLTLRLFANPGLKLGIVTGIVFGLAHLTKASILVGILLFGVVFVIQLVLAAAAQKKAGQRLQVWSRPVLRQTASGVLVFVCFIAVIFPYISAMKARFGQYFYNVNTSFYVWYDSNPQAIAAEETYHFAEAWPNQLSQDQIPSLRNYLRTHSWQQILERIRFGIQEQSINIFSPFSVTNYHLSYLVILLLVFFVDVRRNLSLIRRHPYQILYSLLYFAGYLAAFIWYSPIAPERRFTYGLYIPFMYAVFSGIHAMATNQPETWSSPRLLDARRLIEAANFVMFLTLLANIWLVVTERMYFDRFGA